MNESESLFLISVGNNIFHGAGIELALENSIDNGIVMPQKGCTASSLSDEYSLS